MKPNAITNGLGYYFNNQTKPIERLDMTQAANRLGIKYSDLYNAYASGRDGGFVQHDFETKRKYVLATDIEPLRAVLNERKAGPVKSVQPKGITLNEIAASLNVKPHTVRDFIKTHPQVRELIGLVTIKEPGASGRGKCYARKDAVAILKPMAAWGSRTRHTDNATGVKLPAPTVTLKEKPPVIIGQAADKRAELTQTVAAIQEVTRPLTWTLVAKELAAKHPAAALWVISEKVEG